MSTDAGGTQDIVNTRTNVKCARLKTTGMFIGFPRMPKWSKRDARPAETNIFNQRGIVHWQISCAWEMGPPSGRQQGGQSASSLPAAFCTHGGPNNKGTDIQKRLSDLEGV